MLTHRQLRCGVIYCCRVEVKMIEKLHFMNSCKFEPGVFSCALDSFLEEVWLRVVNDIFSEFLHCYFDAFDVHFRTVQNLWIYKGRSTWFKFTKTWFVGLYQAMLFLLIDCIMRSFLKYFVKMCLATDVNCSEQAKLFLHTAFCVSCQKNLTSNLVQYLLIIYW